MTVKQFGGKKLRRDDVREIFLPLNLSTDMSFPSLRNEGDGKEIQTDDVREIFLP